MYSLSSSYDSDVYFQTDTQTLYITEENNSSLVPELPCSSSGAKSIVFNISSYNSVDVPSFVSINQTTGVLSVDAPRVSTDTKYSFYIDSTISGESNLVHKIINLMVKKCTAKNCQKCSAGNSTIWTGCSSGYDLSSGSWSLTESQTSKSLAVTSQSIVATTMTVTIVLSLFNISSLSSMWSMVSQSQMFFLLFLTWVFIPKDIENIITGLRICLDPSDYFSYIEKIVFPNFVSDYFNFGLEDIKLEPLGIKSDSTIVNLYSFMISVQVFICIHLWISLLNKTWKRWFKPEKCELSTKVINIVFERLIILMNFALYIRLIMSMNQFILISSVSEIYHFNTFGYKRIISLVFANIVLILMILLIWIITFLVYFQKEIEGKRNKFSQFFDGITNKTSSKIYIVFILIRRFVYVIILITVAPKSSLITIWIILILQLIFIILLIFKRPYSDMKSNIIEVINEIYFFVILISLLHFNSIDRWIGTPTTAYIWIISSNNIISFAIIMGNSHSFILNYF